MRTIEQLKLQILILNNVKEHRATKPGTSPYVCDNVASCARIIDGTSGAVHAICEDIRKHINYNFGVEEFLGHDNTHPDDVSSTHPDVLAFRNSMIDMLINRYEVYLSSAQAADSTLKAQA